MSDDATIFIGRQQEEGAGGMRNSRVIKERETFDSAYPSIKGYDYYRKERNSCLQKKKKNTRFSLTKERFAVPDSFLLWLFSSRLLFREKSRNDQVILELEFKVNARRLFLILIWLHYISVAIKKNIYIYLASTSRIAILLVRSKCFSSQWFLFFRFWNVFAI